MRLRRIAGLVCLLVVFGAAGWLLLDWYHLFGEPVSESRVVITASLDATLLLEDGSVETTSGQYVRAGERSGFWLLTNGLPLAVLVFAAMFPVGQLLLSPHIRAS